MKIVHICLANPYVDNWGYQENLLPEYLAKLGYENHIITSNSILPHYLDTKIKNHIKQLGNYYMIERVHVHKILSFRVSVTMAFPFGLYNKLKDIEPNIIIHHNVSPTTLPIVSQYVKDYKCLLLVDNHADELNMNRNPFWRFFYYKLCSRFACKISLKNVAKFYGVTHSRCDFLNKYFGVPKEKIDLLPIGADVDLAENLLDRKKLRIKYRFSIEDYIVVSGGKMGKHKGTLDLIHAIEAMKQSYPNIKLLLFGKFEDEETLKVAESKDFVILFGWCDRIKTLELLKLSDVACWCIHHTTLMEDAIAVETPLVAKKTGTTMHLIEGNGSWLLGNEVEAIQNAIKIVMSAPQHTLNQACVAMKNKINYRTIAKKILDDSFQQGIEKA